MLYRFMNVILCVSFGNAKSGLTCPTDMRTLGQRSSLAVILPPQHERLSKSISKTLVVDLRLLIEADWRKYSPGRQDAEISRTA